MVVLQLFVCILIALAVVYAFASHNDVRKEIPCTLNRRIAWLRPKQQGSYGEARRSSSPRFFILRKIKHNKRGAVRRFSLPAIAYPRIRPLRIKDFFFLFLFFAVIALFRVFINPQSIPDTWYYANNFKVIGNIPWRVLLLDGAADYGIDDEGGFLILTKLLNSLISNQNLYIGILGCFICYGYYYLIKEYSQIVWMSCVLFLLGGFNQSLFVLRQYLAIAIIILSLPFVIRRDLGGFILCVVLAFFFHRTAILFFPVYFLYGIDNKRKFLIYSVIAVVIGRLVISFVLNVLLSFYTDLTAYASDEDGANIKMSAFLVALLLARLVLLRKCYWKKGVNRLFTIVLLCGAAFSILSYGFGFDRIVVYFSTLLCVVIPQTLINIKKPIIKYAFAIAYFAVQVYLWMGSLDHLSTMKFL